MVTALISNRAYRTHHCAQLMAEKASANAGRKRVPERSWSIAKARHSAAVRVGEVLAKLAEGEVSFAPAAGGTVPGSQKLCRLAGKGLNQVKYNQT